MKRKSFTSEFKAKVASGGLKMAEIGRFKNGG